MFGVADVDARAVAAVARQAGVQLLLLVHNGKPVPHRDAPCRLDMSATRSMATFASAVRNFFFAVEVWVAGKLFTDLLMASGASKAADIRVSRRSSKRRSSAKYEE